MWPSQRQIAVAGLFVAIVAAVATWLSYWQARDEVRSPQQDERPAVAEKGGVVVGRTGDNPTIITNNVNINGANE